MSRRVYTFDPNRSPDRPAPVQEASQPTLAERLAARPANPVGVARTGDIVFDTDVDEKTPADRIALLGQLFNAGIVSRHTFMEEALGMDFDDDPPDPPDSDRSRH